MHKKAINFAKATISHPLFSGSAILVIGSMAANAINYIYHLVLGRMLGPSDYAILASIYSVIYLVGTIPGSFTLSVVKFIASAKNSAEENATYTAIWDFTVKVAITGAILIAVLSPFISHFLHIPNVLSVMLVSPIFLFSVLSLVNQAASQGRLKFMGMVLPNISMSIVKFVFAIILIFAGWAVFGTMFAVALGAIVSFVVSRYFLRSLKLTKQKKAFSLQKFFRYSGSVLIQSVAFTSLMSTDVILVKHFLPDFEAGIYAAVSTLGRIIFFAAQPISSAMFPVIAKRQAKGEKYQKIVTAALLTTVGMAGGILLLFAIIPQLTISLSYGNQYNQAGSALLWMGLYYTLYTLAYFANSFFFSRGQTNVALLALAAAVFQILGLAMFHSNIMQAIYVSLSVGVLLNIAFGIYIYFSHK